MSANKFATKRGFNQSNVARQLRGEGKLQLDLVVAILDEFVDVSADWLLYGKDRSSVNMEILERLQNIESNMQLICKNKNNKK
jgi:hypothetical protein